MRYTDVWNDLTWKMGYWVDMEDPYVTYKPKYMENGLLKQIYNKDLMYKYTIPTLFSKSRNRIESQAKWINQEVRDVTDTTVVAQFKVLNRQRTIMFEVLWLYQFKKSTTL
jgi:isoleucyl-tRNA synthetase